MSTIPGIVAASGGGPVPSGEQVFDTPGETDTFTAPYTADYTLEAWAGGGSGGSSGAENGGGGGGYARTVHHFDAGDPIDYHVASSVGLHGLSSSDGDNSVVGVGFDICIAIGGLGGSNGGMGGGADFYDVMYSGGNGGTRSGGGGAGSSGNGGDGVSTSVGGGGGTPDGGAGGGQTVAGSAPGGGGGRNANGAGGKIRISW
jgi:hypothetical protein